MSKNIGVIIPAFNEAENISNTLYAITSQWKNRNGLIVVGDNASTDNTAEVVDRFIFDYPNLPLIRVEEPEKGTGYAADTAAQFAIEKGCAIIARTDGDSTPCQEWLANIDRHMADDAVALLTGPIRFRKDGDYCAGDNLGLAIAVRCARTLSVPRKLSRVGLRVAAGANLITTAEAYQTVGGFPRTSINETDEDMAYSSAIHTTFGFNRMRYARDVVIETSARRLREMGRLGTIYHYTTGRNNRTGNVDVR